MQLAYGHLWLKPKSVCKYALLCWRNRDCKACEFFKPWDPSAWQLQTHTCKNMCRYLCGRLAAMYEGLLCHGVLLGVRHYLRHGSAGDIIWRCRTRLRSVIILHTRRSRAGRYHHCRGEAEAAGQLPGPKKVSLPPSCCYPSGCPCLHLLRCLTPRWALLLSLRSLS
jgi:hypothetical protein